MTLPRIDRPLTATGWFSAAEDARLRQLVYEAFEARDGEDFVAALAAIEDWQWKTAPDRLERHEQERGDT